MQNLLQRGKYWNKIRSQGKEDRVNPQQNLRKLKRKERRKNNHGEKGEKSHFPYQTFWAVTPQ